MNKLFFPIFLCLSSILLNLPAQERTVLNITGSNANTASLTDKEVIIGVKCDFHITASFTPLTNSIIRLNNENAYVFFDNIRPQAVIDSVLSSFYIDGVQAVNNENIRVAIYRHGTVVMPHGTNYEPLQVFSGQNFTGKSAGYKIHTYNNALDSMDNRIRSFKLKRGYMATLANNTDGSGYSRVFIASDGDLEVSTLSSYLDQTVSFIRVFRWEWVSKKGWCQTGSMSGGDGYTNTNRMNGTWLYSWSADGSSKANIEYVPEKWQPYWPSWDQINGKTNISHVMSFNEPDHTEQSNVSVATAVASWPEFMKSGLRIGSPACTDFSAWLYPFMDSIKAHNYRCDYVVIHAYWGGYSASQWYSALKAIHDKTGRPLWIKEWNNGATWTTETWPDDYGTALTKQYNELKAILNVMDTAHFVERYSIYNWVGYKRMLITDDGWITPAGELYRDSKPPLAFSKVNEVIPTYKFTSKNTSALTLSTSADNTKIHLAWTNSDQEFAHTVIIDRKTETGTYAPVYTTNKVQNASFDDVPDYDNPGISTYRVRILLNNGNVIISNEQSFNITPGGDIQYGNLPCSNTDWNTVAFKNSYTTIPAVFLGAPTNNNTSVLLSSKVKISGSRIMNFQLAPWTYQNVSSLASSENVPYFIIKPGTYNFGGLKAFIAKTSVTSSWKTVTFPSAFDTIPVVLVTTTTSNNTIPVTVRVRNVTKTGFDVKLQKETKNSQTLSAEIFSYMAVQQGTGYVNGNKIVAGRTAENAVGNSLTQYAKVSFGETIPHPVFLAQLQTCNDDTVTATLRCRSVLTTEARVFKQREVSTGSTVSAYETAGYIFINPDVVNDVPVVSEPEISIYPNPAKNRIFLKGIAPSEKSVRIYTVDGILIKQVPVKNLTVDISNLAAGNYILKTDNDNSAKFLKY